MCESEAKSSIPETEFIRWIEHFRQKWNEPDLQCYYLAQIAFEIFRLPLRMFSKNKQDITIKDFILKFKEEKPKKKSDGNIKSKMPQSAPTIDPDFTKKLAKIKGAFALFGHIPKVEGQRTERRHVPKKSQDTGKKK